MPLDKNKFETAIEKADKATLVELIKVAYLNIDENARIDAFGSFYQKEVISELSDEEIKDGIDTFTNESNKGRFYDSQWEWTSKSYDQVTPLTRQWYNYMAFWLDVVSESISKRPNNFSIGCYKQLFQLIDLMNMDKIIVSHHDVGEDNLYCKHDYRKLYEDLVNQSDAKE